MGKKPSLLYPTSRGFSLAWLLAGYLCFWLNDKKNLAWFYYTDKGNWNSLGSYASSKFYKNILLNIMSLIIKRAVNGCSALLFSASSSSSNLEIWSFFIGLNVFWAGMQAPLDSSYQVHVYESNKRWTELLGSSLRSIFLTLILMIEQK